MPPLYTQVLIAVACGALLGASFGLEPYVGGLRNEQLGKLGLFVVTLLKTLAIPLIFFAILDAPSPDLTGAPRATAALSAIADPLDAEPVIVGDGCGETSTAWVGGAKVENGGFSGKRLEIIGTELEIGFTKAVIRWSGQESK